MCGMPASVNLVDRPTSRLSNLMTRSPLAASEAQNSSSHMIIWELSPMMSRTGGSDILPKVSYARVIPLVETYRTV